MKIGIATFVDYNNYGNRLQNYAMQEYLKEHGFEVETILNEKYKDCRYVEVDWKTKMWHIVATVIKNIYGMIMPRQKSFILSLTDDKLRRKRKDKNIKFTNRYINESNFVVREGCAQKKKLLKYDYLVAGSDQIWNPHMDAASDFFFLQNVPKEKRVSISASVGVTEIPKEREKQWNIYVNGMSHISVREKSAQELIKRTTGRDATVLLDPTMLVDKKIWKNLVESSKFEYKNKSYIVTYILGTLDDTEENYLKRIAEAENAEIIRLNDKRFEELCTIDVIEFLQFIYHSKLMITDSFHACVFSILFSKQFFVLQRQGQFNDIYSRIQDLLEKFNLQNHAIDSIQNMYEAINSGDGDCSLNNMLTLEEIGRIEDILKIERKKADEYIKKALI